MRVAVINDTSRTKHAGCISVMQTIEEQINKTGSVLNYVWPTGYDWQRHIAKFNALCEAVDVIIVNGEGTIHHTSSRSYASSICAVAPYIKQTFNKPVYLINATLRCLDVNAIDNLKSFDGVYIRDEESEQILRKHQIACNLVPDLALFSEMVQQYRNSSHIKNKNILVTDSVLPDVSQHLKIIAKQVNSNFLMMERHEVKTVWAKKLRSLRCLLLPPSLAPLAKTQSHSNTLSDFLENIVSTNFILTGRFHSVIFAVALKTPFLAIESNTNKIKVTLKQAIKSSNRSIQKDSPRLVPLNIGNIPIFTKEEISNLDDYYYSGLYGLKEMFAHILNSR